MLKKLLCFLLVIPFTLAVTSCGNGNGNDNGNGNGDGNGGEAENATAKDVIATPTGVQQDLGYLYQANNITFLINSTANVATIQSSSAEVSSELDLPTTVNGYPIINIAVDAFANSEIGSVNFNRMHYLRTINSRAFYNNNISQIELSNLSELRTIQNNVFSQNPIILVELYQLPALTMRGTATGTSVSTAFHNLDPVSDGRQLRLINHSTWQTEHTQEWLDNTATAFPSFSRINT